MMFTSQDFTYYDLRKRTASAEIDVIFPGWDGKNEHVVVLSPHDDDTHLGVGYAILAAQANGATVSVVIFCDGCAGYSDQQEREVVVATRQEECVEAYAKLGIPGDRIIRLDYPDFSTWPRMGWRLPGGQLGTFARTIPLFRALNATRVLIPNAYREHLDHEAVARIGSYDVPQAGDPILVDWGAPTPVRSVLEYSVWSDFSPEDALVHQAPTTLRANRALAAPAQAEEVVAEALRTFRSQQQIIAGLLAARQSRRLKDGRMVEVYRWFDPRPPLDYRPYCAAIEEIEGSGAKATG